MMRRAAKPKRDRAVDPELLIHVPIGLLAEAGVLPVTPSSSMT
jgi:hypothetical protein